MIITNLNYNLEKKVKDEDIKNLYSTEIPCFNVKDGDAEDWLRFRCVLDLLEWKDDYDVDSLVRNLWNNLQQAVSIVFP